MSLLERTGPLAALADGLAHARAGEGRAILVSGEAGIGKTSLIEAFVRSTTDVHTLWGACEALSTPHPFGPVYDIVGETRRPLQALLADHGDRAALFAGLLDELGTGPQPTILVLEDVHWADAATLDLVKFLGRRIHRVHALMILTYRDDDLAAVRQLRAIFADLPSRHVARVGLARLSAAAVATLADRIDLDAARLHAATGGNPFFVTEVLANPDAAVPATVRDAVVARADRLAAGARDVLDLAAIVPRAIDPSLIAAVLAPSVEAIDECLTNGLLIADGRLLRFRHELARVAVELAISPAKARALHARTLAALERSSQPVELARMVHHAHLADDAEAVLRHAPLAAAEAASRGARREAAAHCRVQLAYGDSLSDTDRAALLDAYAGHCFELNDLDAAIVAREEAIVLFEKIDDRANQCRSLADHAMPLVRALRNADADDASRRAIVIAETLPPGPLQAKACATEAYLRMLNRDYRDAIAWGERAIALAERFDAQDTRASAYNSVGAALLFVDYPRGVEFVTTAMDIARALSDGGAGVADAYVMLGTASGELHRYEAAERYLDEGIAFAHAHDLDRLRGYMEAWQALVDVHRGRWSVAGDRANAVVERERAGSTNRVMALVALGRLRTRRGDPGLDAVLDEALVLAERTGTLQRIAPVRCARAEAAWLRDDADAVRREVAAIIPLAESKEHPWFVGELSYWRSLVDGIGQASAACAAPYAAQIEGRWREAADAWAALGCPYESARALAEGDEAAQRQALEQFDRLGARPMAERLRRRMRRAGTQAIPRGPRESTRGNDAGLTARELQILRMVADGWPNARIADALSRSLRTVEHHIASILAKLEVGSRSEAVEAARTRRILAQDG